MKMAVNISPAMRVDQYPDEFSVRNKQLWCMWCERSINHKRKDIMIEHLWSRIHQDNRVSKGARMSYDVGSAEAQERRNRRRKKQAKSKARREARLSSSSKHKSTVQSEDSSSSSEDEENQDTSSDLRQLFQDSDSNSSASFEGFDPAPTTAAKYRPVSLSETTEDERRSGRPRKRPAKLVDSLDNQEMAKIGKIADQAAFVSSMARRKKAVADEYSSPSSPEDSPPPARIRSMPIKKQISFSARHSEPLSPISSPPRGSLKMKFSRNPGKMPSEEYDSDKNIKVVSGSGPGDGLKLKFVWKKKHTQSKNDTGHRVSVTPTKANAEEPSGYEQMLKGITDEQVREGSDVGHSGEEIIEEEIVEMKEEEVVLNEEWVAPEEEEVIAKDEDQRAIQKTATATPKQKAAAEIKPFKLPMKSKASAKKAKKVVTYDKKRKMTGYMLWAKQMREKVSMQYPGLEFGDVSKKLGDLWKKIPDKEKQMWKFRNMKMEKRSNFGTFRKSGSKMIETGPKKRPPPPKAQMQATSPPVKNPEAIMQNELARLPTPSTEPIDSAAYFAMLGESFAKLSSKTKKLESKAVIQGAESILLDSLLCAMGPLMILTRQLPELQDAVDHKKLKETLCNIAHIMPGL